MVRTPTILLAIVALSGCGTIRRQAATDGGSGSALGQTIATARTAATTGSSTMMRAAPRTTTTAAPESIHLPPPPTATAPRARAILRVASRFANAYLLYQSGRDPRPVRPAIAETCTPPFARLLLSQPVSVPAAQRHSLAGQPSALGSVTYTGPASLGPGPPLQIVIARYHAVGQPSVVGQLTIELAASGRGWRVTSLR